MFLIAETWRQHSGQLFKNLKYHTQTWMSICHPQTKPSYWKTGAPTIVNDKIAIAQFTLTRANYLRTCNIAKCFSMKKKKQSDSNQASSHC